MSGLSQPRVGELVADRLRREILQGTYGDRNELPNQDELVKRFEISRPSLREALRLLEAEGLISIRRGNVGGARIHPPRPENAAYTFGLVLQSEQVMTSDLGETLLQVEPLCTYQVALQPNRGDEVIPRLNELCDGLEANLDDPDGFTNYARLFHEAIIEGCENHTLRLVVGTLVALWSTHVVEWAHHIDAAGEYPDLDERRAIVQTHRKLAQLIADGKAGEAADLLRDHLKETQEPLIVANDTPIQVTAGPLADRLGRR